MSTGDRKGRERAERERRIIATARQIAESEGWEAVTIRRLASEIEYSQPVLYSHFKTRDDIVSAVALEGFSELATDLAAAVKGENTPTNRLAEVAQAYLNFAFRRPAIYAAMFVLPTGLRFAVPETRKELRAGFDQLVAAVGPFSQDAELAAETFWAALHGMAELERSGRIRQHHRYERIDLVVEKIASIR